MKPKKTKELCSGCYHNDYNYGFMNVKECWSFKSAEIIKRLAIPCDRSPPYNAENATYMMSCFNKKRMVYIDPKDLTSEGYRKY